MWVFPQPLLKYTIIFSSKAFSLSSNQYLQKTFIQNNITHNKLLLFSWGKMHFIPRKEIASKAKHNWLAKAVLMFFENKTIGKNHQHFVTLSDSMKNMG